MKNIYTAGEKSCNPPQKMHHCSNKGAVFLRNRHNNIKLVVTTDSCTTFSILFEWLCSQMAAGHVS